ncbi:hypothetical protein [Amycolatopsis sp. NPDC059657]|uniref:hypothetical protein n=1 Tax=Amycolatopsis sp. NPDC059657 TaxID=3346899 RepID=UPI00366B5781
MVEIEGARMPDRPEASAGGYRELEPNDGYAADSWQEFTPWRPGDPSTAGEAPASYAADYQDDRIYRPSSGGYSDGRGPVDTDTTSGRGGTADTPKRSWRWSEDSRKLKAGDNVRATRGMGSGIFNTVHDGTKGRIVSTEHTLLNGERGTVEFDNGYVMRNVNLSDGTLERRGWFD